MKSQSITQEIRSAIWTWYQEKKLTQTQIGELLGGLNNSTINQWLNGRAKTIRPKNWKALYPHLKPYLPENYSEMANEIEIDQSDHHDELLEKFSTQYWRKFSDSEKYKVLAYAAELLEKSGGHIQPPVLDKVN